MGFDFSEGYGTPGPDSVVRSSPMATRRRYQQSAVLVFRPSPEGPEILLLRNLRDTRWVIPKGLVEPHLSPARSAAKEAREEAGIIGRIRPPPLGSFEYEKWGGICEVEVYLMEFTDQLSDYEEEGLRKRRWVPPKKAAEMVREPGLKKILRKLERHPVLS